MNNITNFGYIIIILWYFKRIFSWKNFTLKFLLKLLLIIFFLISAWYTIRKGILKKPKKIIQKCESYFDIILLFFNIKTFCMYFKSFITTVEKDLKSLTFLSPKIRESLWINVEDGQNVMITRKDAWNNNFLIV